MRHKMNMAEKEIMSSRSLSELKVLTGQAWLTIEDDQKDYFLGAGECMLLPRGKLIVIQTFQPTEVAYRTDDNKAFILMERGLSYIGQLLRAF